MKARVALYASAVKGGLRALFGGAAQEISNGRRVSGAAACCAGAAGIERRSNVPERRDAGELICGCPICRVRLHAASAACGLPSFFSITAPGGTIGRAEP
jgi:hypothetical protein